MRTLVVSALAIGLVTNAAAWAAEAPKSEPTSWQDRITPTFSDRVRGEFVDWFEPSATKAPNGANQYNFFANQLRFGAKINVPHALFTLEAQETELLNLPNEASPPVSKAGNLGPGAIYFNNTHDRDQRELFLKQANVVLTGIGGLTGGALTGGRFDYSDGLETLPSDPALAWLKRARIGERLVGPFGYTHVTRSFDGFKGVYDAPDFNVTAFGSKPTDGGFEISANRELPDVWLAGLAATLKQLPQFAPFDARLFYLFYYDGRNDAVKVDNRSLSPAQDALRKKDTSAISIHTWGAHAITVADAGPGKVDGLLWGAVQSGDWGTLDHMAWAYAAEAGYQLPQVFAAPWLRVGCNRSSGDDNPNDSTHESFFQILPTARIYAQFPFYNLMNSSDLFTQLILKPHSQVTVRTDYHWLRTTESKDLWYSGGGATNDSFFGFAGLAGGGRHELAHLLDIAINVSILKQLSGYVYFGHAFGQGVVGNTFAGREASYGYMELTYRY